MSSCSNAIKEPILSEVPQKNIFAKPLPSEANFSSPLVTIGIPIYNEERFLTQSIKSLLAQDYNNLKFIISDNASTDGTERICREFFEQDGRIDYRRMENNHGAVANFRLVHDLADGKYFMWASGHDLWQPNFVSECVKLLECEPEAVIAFGSSNWIDAFGKPLPRTSGWTDTRGMDSIARFHSLIWGNMHPILGVIRAESLQKTRGPLSTAGADLILLSELILQGDFVHAVETSWSRREFRGGENYHQRIARYRGQEYALSRSFIDRFAPMLRLPVELARSVLRSSISKPVKILLLLSLISVFPAKYVITRSIQTGVKKP